jgi:hypothetical protein
MTALGICEGISQAGEATLGAAYHAVSNVQWRAAAGTATVP